MPRALTARQARLIRQKAQRLSNRIEASPAGVAAAVVGVQAQELPSAALSIRVRSQGLTAAQVDQARQEEGSLAWVWCLRGTLHLVAAQDAAWLIPLLGPGLIASGRGRMAQLGWDEDSAVAGIRLVRRALEQQGESTRAEIAALLKANHLPHEGQAPFHLLYRAMFEGVLVTGSDRGKKPTYVLYEHRLGTFQPRQRPMALAELALRYLGAYAPARPEDLAAWSGLKLSEARQAWQLIAGKLVEVALDGQPAWILADQLDWLDAPAAPEPVLCLLPRYDTYLLGYASRALTVEPDFARRITPGGGVISAVVTVDGLVQGTWKAIPRRGALEITVEAFSDALAGLRPLIEAEAADIGRCIGQEVSLTLAEAEF